MARTTAKSETTFAAVTLLAVAAVTLVVAWHHEPWRDEADVWLLMRDGGMGTMLATTGYAGWPVGWYLLVAPLPVLGLPYFSMTVVNLVLAWAAMAIILARSPFSRTTKVLLVFSYYMAYEYSVLARPYALGLLALFAAAALWRTRWERPIALAVVIVLLANVGAHALLMAALFGALYLGEMLVERRRLVPQIAAVAIMLAGGLLSVYQLLPPEDMPKTHILRGFELGGPIWALGNAFFPGLGLMVPSVLGLAVMVLISAAIGKRVVPQVFLWGSFVLLELLYMFVWIAGYRHAGLILAAAVAAIWVASAYGPLDGPRWKLANGALVIALLWSLVVAARYWYLEIEKPFSGAEEMARFIRTNGLDRYEIAAHRPTASQALLPYLPGKRFYYAAQRQHGSYMLWNTQYNVGEHTPYATAVAAARADLASRNWLLLVNEEMRNPEESGFRLVFRNLTPPFEKRDERYWLYAPLNWSGPPLPEVAR